MESEELYNEINSKRLEKIKNLLSEFGEWKLRCIYLDRDSWIFGMGTIIGIQNNKIQISVIPLPDKKTLALKLVQRNIFIEPYQIRDIYLPL